MEKETIILLDKEIQVINKVIPNIHRGGCGVFTLLMWDTLAFMGVITNPLELFDDHPCWSRNHILLELNGKYIDSLGVHDNTDWMELDVEKPIKLEKLRSKAWNDQIWFKGEDCFNRDDIVPMKKMIHRLGRNMEDAKKSALLLGL